MHHYSYNILCHFITGVYQLFEFISVESDDTYFNYDMLVFTELIAIVWYNQDNWGIPS